MFFGDSDEEKGMDTFSMNLLKFYKGNTIYVFHIYRFKSIMTIFSLPTQFALYILSLWLVGSGNEHATGIEVTISLKAVARFTGAKKN